MSSQKTIRIFEIFIGAHMLAVKLLLFDGFIFFSVTPPAWHRDTSGFARIPNLTLSGGHKVPRSAS